MKNIPFPIKLLGVSVLFAYAVALAFSTYLNLFVLESITNALSQKISSKVDINSIDISFREGIVLTINGIEIRSNYKNKKLFSANEVSSIITYSSLFSENIKIKKSYIDQPNIYVHNLLLEYMRIMNSHDLIMPKTEQYEKNLVEWQTRYVSTLSNDSQFDTGIFKPSFEEICELF